jgi:hypothetical protein
MKMIMRANSTQVSVSTWNINENEENPRNIPTMVFSRSYSSLSAGSRSLVMNVGCHSHWMRFGVDKSK